MSSRFLDLTIGVIFIGFLATGLCASFRVQEDSAAHGDAVTTSQTVWYFKHYSNDRRVLRYLVAIIWLLDALHLALYLVTMFIYLVQKKGAFFGQQPLPCRAQLVCNAFAIGLIQSFYASRIWTLSKKKSLLVVMAIFVTVTFDSVLTRTVAGYVALVPFDIALSAMCASTDVLLCSSLVTLLARSRPGTVGANRLINKLMLYTVHTGLVTSVNATLALILAVVMPTSSIFVMFYYIGARFYSVSLLGTLNARASLRWQAQNMGQFPLPDIQITAPVTPKRTLSDSMPHFHELSLGLQCDTPSTYESISSGETRVYETRVYCDGHRCYALPPDMELGLDKRQSMDISESRIGIRTDPGVAVVDPTGPDFRRTVSDQ
ncbi:uncharacterized protein TRAVEDRAFT_37938 [Trametes versicolor FP-101664 SS1]|uniref:uncharacterized protein n=1 Tax=Trametes versicolor (strain FP-101664) TaxID=717944 RepID=UPI00046229F9|nr:uncharacterized protein TRAVEDRAFT_37938 [Trametes versicolor FP-101664 SS1]EIW57476.1 hypothetical protein TRAVEDRAFT_37938 [Trametes versicolor FP-101664 SS1]